MVDVNGTLRKRELVGGVAPRREAGGELATGVAIRRREKSGHVGPSKRSVQRGMGEKAER